MRKKEDFFNVVTLSDTTIGELAKFLTVGITDSTIYNETSKYLIDTITRFKQSGNETTIHISLSEPDRPSGRERLELVIHEKEHTQHYGALHDTKVWETEIIFYRDTNRLYTTVLGHWNGRIDPLELSAEEYAEWDDRWRQGPRTFSACHLIPPMSIRERSDRDGNLNELYDPSVTPEELEEAEEAISKPVAEVGILNFAKGLGTKLKAEVNREPRVFGGKTKKKKRWSK